MSGTVHAGAGAPSTGRGLTQRQRSGRPQAAITRAVERTSAVGAIALLIAVAVGAVTTGTALPQQASEPDRDQATAAMGRASTRPADARPFETTSAEMMVAGYVGIPYTFPSDVRFRDRAKATDFTMKAVGWDGKPFKHPLYYGVRVARWSPGNRTGVMLDFLHSKAISRPGDELQLEGLRDGKPVPPKAKVEDLFRTLEFSHGHNMLMATGLLRLGSLMPNVSPYVGLGGGVSLPHTEIRKAGEQARTYEYQYAGPVAQALVGIEIRLPGSSVFFEYKFTFADYRVPLTLRDGDLLVTDLWRQFRDWWSGTKPPDGWATTKLASHNFVGGAGPRWGGR